MSITPKTEPDKTCKCGATFNRRRLMSGRLETVASYRCRSECDACKPPRRFVTSLEAQTKRCGHCRTTFKRKRYASGKLTTTRDWEKQRYCSPACKKAAQVGTASLKPRAVAKPRPAARKPQPAQKPVKPPERIINAFTACKPAKTVSESGEPVRLNPQPYNVGAPQYPDGARFCPEHPHERLTSFGCSACNLAAKTRYRPARPAGDMPIWRGG